MFFFAFFDAVSLCNTHVFRVLCRREVTAIAADEDHAGYTITARHWEPKQYLEALSALNEARDKAKSSPGSAGHHLLLGMSTGFAIGAVLLKKGLPFLAKTLPEHTATINQVASAPAVVYVVLVVVCVLIALVAAPNTRRDAKHKKEPTSSLDIPSVGKDGRMVTVDEMQKGGSGGSSVMQGETVEMETIRTKFVVNAAGCYSVSLSCVLLFFFPSSFLLKPS